MMAKEDFEYTAMGLWSIVSGVRNRRNQQIL